MLCQTPQPLAHSTRFPSQLTERTPDLGPLFFPLFSSPPSPPFLFAVCFSLSHLLAPRLLSHLSRVVYSPPSLSQTLPCFLFPELVKHRRQKTHVCRRLSLSLSLPLLNCSLCQEVGPCCVKNYLQHTVPGNQHFCDCRQMFRAQAFPLAFQIPNGADT